MSFSGQNLSVVVVVVVVNFSLSSSSPEPTFSNEGPCPFPRADNFEIAKIHWQIQKASSPEPLGQFQRNLAQSIPGWRDFSLFYWRVHSFPRGDHYENAKKHKQIWKINTFITFGAIQSNLAQSILGYNGFEFVQMKGPALFQGEIIMKLRKYFDEIWKTSSPELSPFQPNLAQCVLGWRGLKFVQMKGPALFQRKIIMK